MIILIVKFNIYSTRSNEDSNSLSCEECAERILNYRLIEETLATKNNKLGKHYQKWCEYTRSRITRTRLYQIIAYFEGHLPHQKSLH